MFRLTLQGDCVARLQRALFTYSPWIVSQSCARWKPCRATFNISMQHVSSERNKCQWHVAYITCINLRLTYKRVGLFTVFHQQNRVRMMKYRYILIEFCSEVKWKSLGRVWLFATTWIVQWMEFFRPEYWVGSRSFFQGIFSTQGSNPGLSHRQILYQLSHQGSPNSALVACYFLIVY